MAIGLQPPWCDALGIRSGMRVYLRNIPASYMQWIQPIPDDVRLLTRRVGPIDVGHVFTRRRIELISQLEGMSKRLADDGRVWVSWPTPYSAIPTELNERNVVTLALQHGLQVLRLQQLNAQWFALELSVFGAKRPRKQLLVAEEAVP